MIRRAAAVDEAALLELLRAVPCIGVRGEVDWRLAKQNPALPTEFYRVGQTAAVKRLGHNAAVFGAVENGEELESFLSFLGVTRVTSNTWAPAGWARKPARAMVWTGKGEAADARISIEDMPPMGEVMDVLTSAGLLEPDARDGFYSQMCTLCNHGYAHVLGVRRAGRLVGTAGLYAITEKEGYIGGVATRPQARGKGYAGALVRTLCLRHGDKPITLLCEDAREGFYRKLGFARMDAGLFVAETPEQKETEVEC